MIDNDLDVSYEKCFAFARAMKEANVANDVSDLVLLSCKYILEEKLDTDIEYLNKSETLTQGGLAIPTSSWPYFAVNNVRKELSRAQIKTTYTEEEGIIVNPETLGGLYRLMYVVSMFSSVSGGVYV